MEMTKERLEEYKSKRAEITELRIKLSSIGKGDSMIGNSVILNGQVYPPRPESVVGIDEKKYERLRKKYSERLAELERDCGEIEEWIEEIQDSLTRRIFRMYYVDGMTQQQVANEIGLDRSRISRKIDDFLKNAHKAQKAHV